MALPLARSYTDLVVWQKARRLVAEVYRIGNTLPPTEWHGLKSQIGRSAVSVISNIAEGWGRGSRGELRRAVNIARGSLYEVSTQLDLTEDLGLVPASELLLARSLIDEVGRMLTSLRRKLSSS